VNFVIGMVRVMHRNNGNPENGNAEYKLLSRHHGRWRYAPNTNLEPDEASRSRSAAMTYIASPKFSPLNRLGFCY
jgi:hypothetical protein